MDDTLSNAQHQPDEFEGNSLASRACSELNVFVKHISSPAIDELGLGKPWMPQDRCTRSCSTRTTRTSRRVTTSLFDDINDKALRRATAGWPAYAALASLAAPELLTLHVGGAAQRHPPAAWL